MSHASILHRSAWEHHKALSKTKEYSAYELSQACLKQAQKYKSLGIFLDCDEESILKEAQASDERRSKSQELSALDGIPVAVKDNIAQKGLTLSCASKILKDFSSPYDATVIRKLRSAGAVLFGRTNMDEFAMGSSTENSAFQKTRNPWQEKHVPGGSSGASAACVASCISPLALGSDTGGSIRQPAAFCGAVGLRPTYGKVSRHGLVAFASSLDQIGPFARNVPDCALLLRAISGGDQALDSTSCAKAGPENNKLSRLTKEELAKLKIGLLLPRHESIQQGLMESIEKAADHFASQGADIAHLQSQWESKLVPLYYILATAEASSNLSRYDGIRYGMRAQESSDLLQLYIRSRTAGFGAEVRRRILLGTFVLSSGYYDAYYKKAQEGRLLVQREYETFFQEVDLILSPTTAESAFALGENADPLSMYKSDLFTIPAALAGLPAMNIPAGIEQKVEQKKGLPLGIQLTAPAFADDFLMRAAYTLEESLPSFRLDYTRF